MGMAGHVMYMHLNRSGKYNVSGVARAEGEFVDEVLDVTDFTALDVYLNQVKPDYVVNCIGVLVSQSANDVASAVLLNSYLPHFLSSMGSRLGFRLIHISTDCVFSGKKGAYVETSFKDGDDYYARSKALGEVVNERDLTIRTSIVGPELKRDGTGLFDFFLKQKSEMKGYTEALWSGVTTLVLAQAVDWIIEHELVGLVHLTNGQAISKYDLLLLFKRYTQRSIEIEAVDGWCVDKTLLDTQQKMPNLVPSYDVMVSDMVDLMKAKLDLYAQYSL